MPYHRIKISCMREFKGAVATPQFFDSIHSFDRTYFFTYILKFSRRLDAPGPSYSRHKTGFLTKNLPLGVSSLGPILYIK
jgi:hypothetical protein